MNCVGKALRLTKCSTLSSSRDLSSGSPRGRRRVVVSGLGIVCPLGVGIHDSWSGLLSGTSSCALLEGDQFGSLPCRLACLIPMDPLQKKLSTRFLGSEMRQWPRAALLAVLATDEAMAQAGLDDMANSDWKNRTGVSIGSGMIDLSLVDSAWSDLKGRGAKAVSPYFIPQVLLNTPAGLVSIKRELLGPCTAPTTACAASLHAVAESFWNIREGRADMMICGGSESCISPLSIAAFSRMRALSTFHSSPGKASRPFDKNRDGFVLGEGAAVMVLECLESALERGVHPIAEILGCGSSGDAFHISSPSPDGRGARAAIAAALGEAGVAPEEIGYVNAHATSTPQGDTAEAMTIHSLFPDAFVSSCKGSIGHLLGAAGAAELLFTILAVQEGTLPPTANLDEVDTEGGIDKLNHVIKRTEWGPGPGGRRVALKNSFGFGGTNASVCIASYVP